MQDGGLENQGNSTQVPPAAAPVSPVAAPQPIAEVPTSQMPAAPAAPAAPQPVRVPKPPRRHRKLLWSLISLALLCLLVFAGYYYEFNKYGGLKVTTAAYRYGPLKSVSVAGDKAGHNASFSVPVEFTDTLKSTKNSDLAFYYTQDHSKYQLARVSLIEGKSAVHPANYYQKYHQILGNYNDTNYAELFYPILRATTDRLTNAYGVTFKPAKLFQTANIKDNAWSSDFTAVKIGNQDSSLPANIEGRSLIVISKDATYYMVVEADTGNWKANQPTWNQIFNSLKVDQ